MLLFPLYPDPNIYIVWNKILHSSIHPSVWKTDWCNALQDEKRCWSPDRSSLKIPSKVWRNQTLPGHWWCLQRRHRVVFCHGLRRHIRGSSPSGLLVSSSLFLPMLIWFLINFNCYSNFVLCFSETLEGVPGSAGHDGVAGTTPKTTLWNLPRKCPRPLVQEWTADPTQWSSQHHTQG